MDTIQLLNHITRSLVPHRSWDNEGTAEAMTHLAIAKTFIELGATWKPITESWAIDDSKNTLWFQVFYSGKNTFATSGPTAGEPEVYIFYLPSEERLASLVRPDWTNQYIV